FPEIYRTVLKTNMVETDEFWIACYFMFRNQRGESRKDNLAKNISVSGSGVDLILFQWFCDKTLLSANPEMFRLHAFSCCRLYISVKSRIVDESADKTQPDGRCF